MLNKGPLKDGFDRPDGVLLFLGPTGVGKTELAKAVAEFLFGDEKKMIRVDMSEYQDGSVAVDKLIGMPRGIVGSERGGVLTNQLRDTPYTVLLLDEVEKASPNLLTLFLQAFDEGWLTDGRGKRVYLSDAIVIMTSNLGSEHFRKLTNPMGFRSRQVGVEQVQGEVMRELERRFPPEFRNRVDEVVLFAPLTQEEVTRIARHYLAAIGSTLERAGRQLVIVPGALEKLVEEGHSLAFGARFLKRVIDDRVKLPISQHWNEGQVFVVDVRDGKDRRGRARGRPGAAAGVRDVRQRSAAGGSYRRSASVAAAGCTRPASEQVREREADLRDEHHPVHVRPGDVVLFDGEALGPPQHQVTDVEAVARSSPAPSAWSSQKWPVRTPVQAPIGIIRNGTTKDGEIIQAARVDAELDGQRAAPAARVAFHVREVLGRRRAQQEQPEDRADEPGLDADDRLHRRPAGHLQQHPAGNGDRHVGPDAEPLGAERRHRVERGDERRGHDQPEALVPAAGRDEPRQHPRDGKRRPT